MTMASMSGGKDCTISLKRIITSSTTPPIYPEMPPNKSPTPKEISTVTAPAAMEMRLP
jgi:hypothetical protein